MSKSTKKSAWPVTIVFSWEVQAGKEQAFSDWAHGITTTASRWPGHMGTTTLRPPNGKGAYNSVLRFDTEKHLQAWLESAERDEWIDQLKGIAIAHVGSKATGLESWFEVPGTSTAPPPRWKMVVVTFLSVYPLSLLLAAFISPHITEWNIFIRSLILPIVVPVVLTYFSMPFLTQHVFKRWLYKPQQAKSGSVEK